MGIEPKLEIGARAQFDVVVNGEVVASRSRGLWVRWLGVGWPDEAAVVRAVRARMVAAPT